MLDTWTIKRTEVDRKEHSSLVARRGDEATVVWVGNVPIGGNDAIVIAGPCSVESRDQVMRTAHAVKELGAVILRGGAYKPRTSPYDFQGLGVEGLRLLREAGDSAAIPIVTEIMSEDDVAIVCDHADMLQVGARNMQNFALLKKLARTRKPILLKRGASATVKEWLSAAEYLLHGGNESVVLCERGIKTFDTSLRNTLDLAAVALVKEMTHLPVIVDPSHATGKQHYRELRQGRHRHRCRWRDSRSASRTGKGIVRWSSVVNVCEFSRDDGRLEIAAEERSV